jgi:hypothetical protein
MHTVLVMWTAEDRRRRTSQVARLSIGYTPRAVHSRSIEYSSQFNDAAKGP